MKKLITEQTINEFKAEFVGTDQVSAYLVFQVFNKWCEQKQYYLLRPKEYKRMLKEMFTLVHGKNDRLWFADFDHKKIVKFLRQFE